MDKDLGTERFQTWQEEESPEESRGRDTNWARGSPRSPAGQRLDPRQTARRTSSSKLPAFLRAQGALGQGNRGPQAPVPRQVSVDLRSNLATGRHRGSDRTGRPARGQKAAGLGLWPARRRPREDDRTGNLWRRRRRRHQRTHELGATPRAPHPARLTCSALAPIRSASASSPCRRPGPALGSRGGRRLPRGVARETATGWPCRRGRRRRRAGGGRP